MLDRLKGVVPRAVMVGRGMKPTGGVPVGRVAIPPHEARQRAYHLAGEVAAGRLPLDETSAQIVARALEAEHRRLTHGRK